jgi:hypothetical protein
MLYLDVEAEVVPAPAMQPQIEPCEQQLEEHEDGEDKDQPPAASVKQEIWPRHLVHRTNCRTLRDGTAWEPMAEAPPTSSGRITRYPEVGWSNVMLPGNAPGTSASARPTPIWEVAPDYSQ